MPRKKNAPLGSGAGGAVVGLAANRSRHGFFWRPTGAESPGDDHPVQVRYLFPLAQKERFPVRSNSAVGSPVSRLLFLGRPSAVVGFVVPAIVYSVDGVLRSRSSAHVGKKGGEFIPPRTNGNPSSPVEIEIRVPFVSASCEHGGPASVFCALAHLPAVGFSVPPIAVLDVAVEFGRLVSSHAHLLAGARGQGQGRARTLSCPAHYAGMTAECQGAA